MSTLFDTETGAFRCKKPHTARAYENHRGQRQKRDAQSSVLYFRLYILCPFLPRVVAVVPVRRPSTRLTLTNMSAPSHRSICCSLCPKPGVHQEDAHSRHPIHTRRHSQPLGGASLCNRPTPRYRQCARSAPPWYLATASCSASVAMPSSYSRKSTRPQTRLNTGIVIS